MASPLGGADSSHPPPTSTSYDKAGYTDSLNNTGVPPWTDQGPGPNIDAAGNSTAGSTAINGKGTDQKATTSQPKASSATCIPKTVEQMKVDLPSQRMNNQIQFMKDHALIGKFLGFWPIEKALHGWIASKLKPKGQVTL